MMPTYEDMRRMAPADVTDAQVRRSHDLLIRTTELGKQYDFSMLWGAICGTLANKNPDLLEEICDMLERTMPTYGPAIQRMAREVKAARDAGRKVN